MPSPHLSVMEDAGRMLARQQMEKDALLEVPVAQGVRGVKALGSYVKGFGRGFKALPKRQYGVGPAGYKTTGFLDRLRAGRVGGQSAERASFRSTVDDVSAARNKVMERQTNAVNNRVMAQQKQQIYNRPQSPAAAPANGTGNLFTDAQIQTGKNMAYTGVGGLGIGAGLYGASQVVGKRQGGY